MRQIGFRYLITLSSLFYSIAGYAQCVTGRTIDGQGQPVIGVVVIEDQTNATVTGDDGFFEISTDENPCSLTFRHISYEELVVENCSGDIGNVVLKEAVSRIDGVEIRGRRSVVKVEGTKLIYDIQRLSEGKVTNNAFEAVAELPAISREGDQLSVIGAGGTTVVINGKPSLMSQDQLVQYLKSIPVERLEKVETTYNAPPQWHTFGAAINIVLRRDPDQLNGRLQAEYTRNRANSYNAVGNMYIGGRRLSADIVATYGQGAGYNNFFEHNRHIVQDVLHDIRQTTTNKMRTGGFTLYGSLDYRLKKSSSLTLSYYGQVSPRRWNAVNELSQSNLFGEGSMDRLTCGTFQGMELWYRSGTVSAGASYSYIDNHIDQSSMDDILDFANTAHHRVNHVVAFVDISHSLPYEWALSYGARFNFTNNSSDQILRAAEEVRLESLLNESNASLYVSAGYSFQKKINLSVTLRGDYSVIDNYANFNLLPSLSMTIPIEENVHTLQYSLLSWRRDPPYSALREYYSYSDAYHIDMGNPELRSEIYYHNTLSYILKNRYIFSFRHSYVDKMIFNQSYLSSDNLLVVKQPLNINSFSVFAITAAIPFNIAKWWNVEFNILAKFERFKADDWHNISFDKSQFAANLFLTNYFNISHNPDIQLKISGIYYSGSLVGGFYKNAPNWYVDAGAQYTFARDRAVFSVTCGDVFQSYHIVMESLLDNQVRYFEGHSYPRRLTIAFTWKFGNYSGTQMRSSNMDTSRIE